MKSKTIYCCQCKKDIQARFTNGAEIYPHRDDLKRKPFWRCDNCKNYVGCHHKSDNPFKPLGNIPTPELRNARRHIHALLDPLWEKGLIDRSDLYYYLSQNLGYVYHTAEIKTIEEARRVWVEAKKLADSM